MSGDHDIILFLWLLWFGLSFTTARQLGNHTSTCFSIYWVLGLGECCRYHRCCFHSDLASFFSFLWGLCRLRFFFFFVGLLYLVHHIIYTSFFSGFLLFLRMDEGCEGMGQLVLLYYNARMLQYSIIVLSLLLGFVFIFACLSALVAWLLACAVAAAAAAAENWEYEVGTGPGGGPWGTLIFKSSIGARIKNIKRFEGQTIPSKA